MYKRMRKIVSLLLTGCLLLSVVPGEILAVDGAGDGSIVFDGTSVEAESIGFAPEELPVLEADCQVLRYVNEEVFREKNHVARVPSEETLSSYVFQNADGSRTVYFLDEPVKFVDAGGVVREKDLTLKAVGTGGSLELNSALGTQAVDGYTTTANDIGLTLPRDPGDGICLTYEGHRITLIPQGGTEGVTAQLAEGGVNYPGFFGEGISLRYTPLLSGVKEDIILRSYTGVNTFTFLLNTGGLGLYEENGRYFVADSADAKNPLELGDLVTFDANGRFSVGTTTLETLTPNQSYRLTLTVDEAFLTDENTAYPVTIDPTLEVNGGGIEDATIYSGAPDLNTGNWTYLHTGYYNDTYKIARTLFRFPELTGNSMYLAPDEFTISNVSFHIWEATGSAPETVCVYSNVSTSGWEEQWDETGVTWNNANLTYYRLYDIGDPGYGNETIYDITDLAKAWQSGEESVELGLTLRSISEVAVDKAFYSTEWSSNAYRPYLVADFNTTTAGLNRSVMDLNVGQTGYLNVTGISGTVTWSSSDPSVATIASSGAVVGHKAGTATITANVSGEAPMTCTVYVKIPDAVYYITSSLGTTLAVDGSLDRNAPVKLLTKSDVAGHAKMRQLWKIKYLGEGYYSIRSLYKSDRCLQVESNAAMLDIVSTGDYISNFEDDSLWKIEALGSGYTLQNCGVTTNKQCLCPSGTSVVTSMFVSGNSLFTWTLTPDTAVPDLMVLIDADTCLPVNGAIKSVSLGQSATLEDLGLMVSFISQTSNTTNYYWQVSDSSIASITGSNNKVTALARGETTISLHASSSTNTPMYLIVHSPYVDDGTYYIRNWNTNLYLEVFRTSSGYDVYGNTFSHSSMQLWNITYLGNREYSIQSVQSPYFYMGINNDSAESGKSVVPRLGELTDGMKWTFEPTDRGALKIKAQCTQENLYISNASSAPYCQIKQQAYSSSETVCSDWLFCEASNQIVPEIQEQSNLCWVTCARMASFKYMKSPINQGSAVYYVHMGYRKIPNGIESNLNKSGYTQYTSEALEYILGWDGCTYYKEHAIYSDAVLMSLLDAGNVVIAGRYEKSGEEDETGHSYLVYDYRYNSSVNRYEFYIYDPAAEHGSPLLIRSYAWLCDGDTAYDSSHKDGRVWRALVTYRIGSYLLTISDPQ